MVILLYFGNRSSSFPDGYKALPQFRFFPPQLVKFDQNLKPRHPSQTYASPHTHINSILQYPKLLIRIQLSKANLKLRCLLYVLAVLLNQSTTNRVKASQHTTENSTMRYVKSNQN